MFDVVIPKDCSSKHCLGVLAWAFSVANPGPDMDEGNFGAKFPLRPRT